LKRPIPLLYLVLVTSRPFLAVMQYDGGQFVGWQRQPTGRTVQAEFEAVLERLMGRRTAATGAGRTDTGVHALGQAVSFVAGERWFQDAAGLGRALNGLLPPDIWVQQVHEMRAGFNARRSAIARRYRYVIGTDAASRSPFRRPYEWALGHGLDTARLDSAAATLPGDHDFRGLAAAGAAKPDYRCRVALARWERRAEGTGVTFTIEADRFLHRMVRFLVGTMVDIALARRPGSDLSQLLTATHNQDASPPAPPQGLYLEAVRYPRDLYAEVHA
jgi:tRNA pseudouridine38-40 synthase